MGKDRRLPAAPAPIRFAPAVVEAVLAHEGAYQELGISFRPRDGQRTDGPRPESGLAFHDVALGGPLAPGDQVVVNTTAVDLGLGTGGYYFVAAVSGGKPPLPREQFARRRAGHVMKLRYTPLQRRVLAGEEAGHPGSRAIRGKSRLDGMPVIVGSLHSQLAPAVAGLRSVLGPRATVVYVMNDAGALPAAFSRVVRRLRAEGLIDAVITAGHAYGGDVEAVNPLSALLLARHLLAAQVALVMPGPGIVGTGHPLGTTALQQAAIMDMATAVGGRSLAVVRLSFRDRRPRHRGVSHHTLTNLALAARPGLLPLPVLPEGQGDALWSALAEKGLLTKHFPCFVDGGEGLALLRRWLPHATVMGRTIDTDPAFFAAAAAAGRLAGYLAEAKAPPLDDASTK